MADDTQPSGYKPLDLSKIGGLQSDIPPAPDLDGNVFAGSHIDPDEAAQAIKDGRQLGVSPSAVRGTVVPKQPPKIDLERIKSSGSLSAYAGRGPEQASVANDDSPAWTALATVFQSAADQFRRDVVQPAADTLTAIKSGLSRSDAAVLGVAAAPFGVAAQAAQPLVGTVLPENPFARGEAALLKRAVDLNQFADEQIAPVLTRSKGLARDVMEGWGSFIPSATSMALTAVTRMPAAGLTVAGATSGGGAYVEGRGEGLAPAEALMFAVGEGVVEAGTEMIPAMKIVDDLVPGAPLHKMLLNQLAAEIPGEQIATILQDLNAWAYLNPEKTLAEFVAERPDAAVKTLVATIVTSTAQTSAIGLAASAQNEVAEMQKRKVMAERAAAASEYLQNLNDSAKASKMLTRDPLGLAQIITGMAEENGAPSKFYIDAADLTGVLLQEGKTITDLADLLPSTKGQIIDSFIAGGTVEIPAGEFAVNLNGSTLQQGMAAHIRLEEDGFSVEQAKAFEADYNEKRLKTAEGILRSHTDGSEFRREAARVRDTVKVELIERGRMSPEAAETNAKLVEAFYVTAAKDWGNGMTPGKLFDRVMKGRRVVLPEGAPAPAEPVIEQGEVDTRTPEFKAFFSDSKITTSWESTTDAPRTEPRRLYHATPNSFSAFRKGPDATDPFGSHSGPVIFMTDEADDQRAGHNIGGKDGQFKDGVNVMPLYASIQKPLFTRDAEIPQVIKQYGLSMGYPYLWKQSDVDTLKAAGFDGVVLFSDTAPTEVIAFEPEQVKSVFNERPTSSPDILNQQEVDTKSEAFKAWFGDSKVVEADGQPLVVYRGESRGDLYTVFDRRKTNEGIGFFFAEDKQQADYYAGRGTEARAFYLKAENLLDLTRVDSPESRKFLKEYAAEFDEWVDRYSGEDVSPADIIESGMLYDYEGTGSGTRWKALFSFAESMGFDGVRVLDATDGVNAPTVVVFKPEQIKSATDNRGTFDPADPNILNQAHRYTKDEIDGLLADNILTAAEHRAMMQELASQENADATRTGSDTQPQGRAGRADGRPAAGQDGKQTVAGQPPAAGFVEQTAVRSRRTNQPFAVFRGSRRGRLTPADFTVENLGKASGKNAAGLGVFFTPVEHEAASHGQVQKVFLDLRNPKMIPVDEMPAFDSTAEANAFARALEKQGFDGIAIKIGHLAAGGEQVAPYHFVAFKPEQVVLADDGGVYRQGGEEGPRLTSLHNLSAENLAFADKMGGIAVPSIGVVTESAGGVEGFGEITLIGTKGMADPSAEPVFSSDAYTARFPKPEFKAAKQKDADKLVAFIKPWADKFADADAKYQAWERTHENPDPQELIQRALNSAAWQAAFLESKGVVVEPSMRSQRVPSGISLEAEQIAKLGPQIEAVLARDSGEGASALMESPEFASLQEAFTAEVRDYAKRTGFDPDKDVREQDTELYFGRLDRLLSYYRKRDQQEVDKSATREALADAVQPYAVEFKSWIEGKVLPIMGEPMLKIGRKKVAYTLDNIVEYMTSAKVKGEEKTMTYGAGQARAAVSEQFKDLERMREVAAKSIVDPAAYDAAKDESGKLLEKYRDAVVEYTTYTDWRGNPDTWEALDSSMRAIAKFATSKVRDKSAMRAALKAEGFKASAIPNEIIEQAIEAADAMLRTPVPYFEAKPQRAVKLSEFAGAVIPVGTSADVRSILEKHGIKYREYADGNGRQSVVRALTAELAAEGKDVLFQDKGKVRGTFNPTTLAITLTNSSNLSTFLHESGHAFLDITMILAQEPDAPDAVRQRAGAVLSWLGITGTPEMSAIDTWLSMSLEEKRPHHEKWAETFEQYLMKGQAPSLELAEAFARFRDWMVSIYKTLKEMVRANKLAALDPEVTAIMDRMLATDEQIAEAKSSRSVIPMFTSKPGSMTPEQWRAYQAQVAEQDAHERHVIDRAKLGDMQWIRTKGGKLLKALQKDAQVKRAEMKARARRNILSQPAYIARQILTSKVLKEAKAKREKDSKYLAEIDPSRDSAIIAIAKMGGMNEAAFVAEYGIDPADFRVPEMRAGHKRPAIVKSGGLRPGEVGEQLAELGYLPLDQNGKWDNQALEDLLDDAARGNERYSLQADYDAITGKQEQYSRAQMVDENGFGGARLSRMDIDGRYGWIDGLDGLGDMVADVGAPVDYIAMVSGFETGEQMLKALLTTRDINEAIEAETDKLMLEAYGDISSPEALQRKVDEALAGHNRARIIATELKIIAGGQGSVRRTVAAAREAARNILSGVKLSDLRPNKYQIAATRASRAAMDALGKGEDANVIKHKRTEVLNNELFRQASKARDEIDRKRTKFREMFKGKDEDVAKRRNMDIVNVARAVLADYGLAPTRGGQRAQAYMDLLREYSPQAAADITSMLEMLPEQKDQADLTLSEFRALADVVEGMWAIARADKVVTINGEKLEMEAVAGELVGRIAQLKGGAIPENKLLRETATRFSKFVDGWRGAKAMLIRVEQWADMVGPEFTKYIFRPVSEAVAAHRNWRVQYLRKYRDLLKTIEKDLSNAPIKASELGFTFSNGKMELLHAILHTGNNSNKRKLLLGRPGWSDVDADGNVSTAKWDAFINRMVKEGVLTKADFDFVQSVWDMMEEMKPASQEAHHKMYGYYFDEITASPVVTPFGVYKGGYVPAIADRANPDVAPKVEAEELLHAGNSFMFPTTGRGFTKGRVEYNKPLELDLRAIGMHIDKVSRFVNIEPAVREVARICMREDVRNAIEAVTPGGVNIMITPWLQRSARQTVSKPGSLKLFDSFCRYLREKSGISTMAANVVNVLQQTTGFSVAATKVPAPYLMRALWAYKSGPRTLAADISKKSAWMRDRLSNQAMEMQAQIERIVIGSGPMASVEKADQFFRNHGYFLQTALQNQMDIVVWSGAYDHALASGMDGPDAVAVADGVVRMTQGTFAPEDIAAFEAGTPAARMFFQFAGYFNMLANTMGGEVTKAVRDLGYGRRTGRLFYVYMMGMLLPAVVGQLIAGGAPDDEDDEDGDGLLDEWMKLFFMSQASTAAAMVPIFGTVPMTVLNQFDEQIYNDKMNISPVLSFGARAVERAVPSIMGITDALAEDGEAVDSLKKKDLKDALTIVALATGIPTGQIGKSAGYVLDVEQGNVAPETTLDYIGGIVRGR